MKNDKSFEICKNSGFRMTFENGWTISVQWGWGNYCENQVIPKGKTFNDPIPASITAEIAIFDDCENWFVPPNAGMDSWVWGHILPDDVAVIMNEVRKQWPIGDLDGAHARDDLLAKLEKHG